jgi:membrane protein DedA with SNARE-associated domain
VAIYLAVGVLAAVENVFPLVPSDAGILVVAALVVREGPLDPWLLWGVATLGNTLGAIVPWLIARRFGPRFAQSRSGRRLLPPDMVSLVEREYVRFGLPGIFLCRLIPAVRFIVAPFAGLVGIGPLRTFAPLGLAASARRCSDSSAT